MTLPRIQIYDTTLRDGTQSEGFNLSANDKVRIAQKLDELGVAFIELTGYAGTAAGVSSSPRRALRKQACHPERSFARRRWRRGGGREAQSKDERQLNSGSRIRLFQNSLDTTRPALYNPARIPR